MIRKYWGKAAIFIILSILLEVVVWNHRAWFSVGASNQPLEYTREGNSFYVTGMSGDPG